MTMTNWKMWMWGGIPVLLLITIVTVISQVGTGVKEQQAAPIEVINFQKITLVDEGFKVSVLNSGPNEVTISQVIVDDAFWNADFSASATLERFEKATISIPYPWVEGDPHEIKLITSNGLIFSGEVDAAMKTPEPSVNRVMQYALIGFYVGIVPVSLGLLWYPLLRRFTVKGMQAVLAFTVGLLLFLVIDTFEEGLELGREAPAVFQGPGLVWFGAILSFLFLLAMDQAGASKKREKKNVAFKIAGGIGLHNLGEGLAIGAAFAAGEAALGTFLIIGFTLHNVTEGVGIAAPLLNTQPKWNVFVYLALIAGAPAIVGTWIGGFILNDTLAALFFGIGAGAILQVIYVIGKMIAQESRRIQLPAVSWLNFSGVLIGIIAMYATALLVNF
ncbi:ZIP family metal transporter [Paenibacillus sp. MMO-177]|uniref:ZIP family metal transporter n=1 Tax=Paenibacillus sp. MMO-177 TaxID=3081289 RepID=UPI0030170CD0